MGNRALPGEAQCAQCVVNCYTPATADCIDGNHEYVDSDATCAPVGAIFDETLEELSALDRNLLLFSSGSNLVGVRWLYSMGVSKGVADNNGTTALHAACRSGSLPIIRELVANQGEQLDATDIKGWTPLHVAVTMCRRSAVMYLLHMRAPVDRCTYDTGQFPTDMCRDLVLRKAIAAFLKTPSLEPPDDASWIEEREWRESGRKNEVHYEPFFVPRKPAIDITINRKEVQEVGECIFNMKPGQGLAFLVATGCVLAYPKDIGIYLRKSKLNRATLGSFLGEPFSLAQLLRAEFINSNNLFNAGIVKSLVKVFSNLMFPPDLRKIDRLVRAAAEIWWRQHVDCMPLDEDNVETPHKEEDGGCQFNEVTGFELRNELDTVETLYQLMFSVVMLHWHVHHPRDPSLDVFAESRNLNLPMTPALWMHINRGLIAHSVGERSLESRLLGDCYRIVSESFLDQLMLRQEIQSAVAPTCQESTDVSENGEVADDAVFKIKLRPDLAFGSMGPDASWSSMSGLATLEGWVRIVGSDFQKIVKEQTESLKSEPDVMRRDQAASLRDCRGLCGQAYGGPTSSVQFATGLPSWEEGGEDQVWLSLCGPVLLISKSASSGDAPYAFVHLRQQVRVEYASDAYPSLYSVTIAAANAEPGMLPDNFDIRENTLASPRQLASLRDLTDSTFKLIVLLSDGQWKEKRLSHFEFQAVSKDVDEDETVVAERWAWALRNAVDPTLV
eukprot:TRINITY_DN28653_c0_g1_i1.p1 TRINITY_DN28653_c0_g1~~TRINITY_DN28653_c0_g1_i1.p1  ORF type:complete len:729 (+),score=117.64 TRINITY_DN28653_c0_g1_i1:123-2309(+)